MILIAAEGVFCGYVIRQQPVAALFLYFGGGVFQQVLALGGKADDESGAVGVIGERGQNIGVFGEG